MVLEEPQDTALLTTTQRRQLLWQIYQVILADSGTAAAPTPMDELPRDSEADAVSSAPGTLDRDALTEVPSARPLRRAA